VEEIQQLIDYADPDELFIDDDTLLKNPAWVREFCALYKERISRPFYCNARPETIKDDLVRGLKEAGCKAIGIGIESGSARIRWDVLNRTMTEEVIINAFRSAHSAGLKTWSFNMVGLPGETAEDLQQTIEINEVVATDFIRVSVFTPYPGTPIFVGDPSLGGKAYIRRSADLLPELASLHRDWLLRLRQEGRLWYTDSEDVVSC
jgi:radical SAM superfamily enzyme YgiQ (UPF0313 family)